MSSSHHGDTAMDMLLLTSIILSGLAALGLASVRWGSDSRDPMTDDHQRCTPDPI